MTCQNCKELEHQITLERIRSRMLKNTLDKIRKDLNVPVGDSVQDHVKKLNSQVDNNVRPVSDTINMSISNAKDRTNLIKRLNDFGHEVDKRTSTKVLLEKTRRNWDALCLSLEEEEMIQRMQIRY